MERVILQEHGALSCAAAAGPVNLHSGTIRLQMLSRTCQFPRLSCRARHLRAQPPTFPAAVCWPAMAVARLVFSSIIRKPSSSPRIPEELRQGSSCAALAGKGEWPGEEFICRADDGSVAAIRHGNWKVTFLKPGAPGLRVWRVPFTGAARAARCLPGVSPPLWRRAYETGNSALCLAVSRDPGD